MTEPEFLDRYIPRSLRETIEGRFLTPIDRHAHLEALVQDPGFSVDPRRNPSFFADHGVVHHRNVCKLVLDVIQRVNGYLIPHRDERRLEFMKGYGIMLALIHDLGMADFSEFGRRIHSIMPSQLVFQPPFDDIIDEGWAWNVANLPWRVDSLVHQTGLKTDPRVVLRELLSMSICHSKSEVSADLLNDPYALRLKLQRYVSRPLIEIYDVHKAQTSSGNGENNQPTSPLKTSRRHPGLFQAHFQDSTSPYDGSTLHGSLERFYEDFENDSYLWLASDNPELILLAEDVIDTLRCLRCADALRQRGTALKTTGDYEIFIDQLSANAIYALRLDDGRIYLLEVGDPISAGEANITSSQLDHECNLRISFQRGSFPDGEKTHMAASNAALVINDIQADAIGSFARRSGKDLCLKQVEDVLILIEGVDDNLRFSDMVAEQLQSLNPAAGRRLHSVPSLQSAAPGELERYIAALELDWNLEQRQEVLAKVSHSGHKTDSIDPAQAFKHVRLVTLHSGEILIEAGASSGFVYIPMEAGLRAAPLGGYKSAPVKPWIPLGVTGVIRGALRNATVSSDTPVQLLAIPKDVYLRFWHSTYTVQELDALLQAA